MLKNSFEDTIFIPVLLCPYPSVWHSIAPGFSGFFYTPAFNVGGWIMTPFVPPPSPSIGRQRLAESAAHSWNYKLYSVAVDSIDNTEEAPDAEDIEVMITGISGGNQLQTEYQIYPNPVSSVLYIETETPGNRFIEIITIDGRIIRKKLMTGSREIINISGLDKGLYMIRISGDNFNEIQKIIID